MIKSYIQSLNITFGPVHNILQLPLSDVLCHWDLGEILDTTT